MVNQFRSPRNLSIQINGFPYTPGDTGGGAPTFSYDQELRAGDLDMLPSFRDDVAPLNYLAARTPDLSGVTRTKQGYACLRVSSQYTPNGLIHAEDVLNISDIGVLRFSPGLLGPTYAPTTLDLCLLSLFSASGAVSPLYYVVPDPSLGSFWTSTLATFAYPTADFMDTLRNICSGLGLEIVPVGRYLVITTPSKRITPSTVSDFKITATTPSVVPSVGIQWYDADANVVPRPAHNYPPVLYSALDAQNTITINANEVQTISVTANGVSGNLALMQPVCVSSIPMIPYDGSSGSIFCVTGSDGYIVSPARWAATGGSIVVTRGNGPFEYIVTIYGPSDPTLSPYTITEGPDFPALYLVSQADGVVFKTRQYLASTGANYAFANDVTVLPDPTYVDCPYVNTPAQAWSAMYRLMRANNSVQYTATGTLIADTVLPQQSGLPPYYQIQGVPIPQLCSARFYWQGHYWRPTQITWSPDARTVAFTANEFTTTADFNTAFAGMTFAQFDTAAVAALGMAAPTFGDLDALPIFNRVYQ